MDMDMLRSPLQMYTDFQAPTQMYMAFHNEDHIALEQLQLFHSNNRSVCISGTATIAPTKSL